MFTVVKWEKFISSFCNSKKLGLISNLSILIVSIMVYK